MAVQVEKISQAKTRLTLTVDAATVNAEKEKTLKTLRREARVPGFRPGKAPIEMIKRRYKSYLDDEVKRNLLGELLPKAIEDEKIKTLGRPELEKEELAENGDLVVVAVMDTWPEVQLGEYKGMEIKREKVVVLPAAVDGRLEHLRQQHVTFSPVTDRDVAENGDTVELEYEGKKNGAPFKGGSSKDFKLELGSGTFIPGFEEGVIGMKVGETKDLPLTFPEMRGRKDLSNQPVTFTVTLKAIMKRELPALDDDFAKDTGLADTLDALKQTIQSEIEKSEESRTMRNARRAVLAKLVELHPIEPPQRMVDDQIAQQVRRRKIDLAMAGAQLGDDPSIDERLKGIVAADARQEVQAYFIFQAIAEKEGIAITDQDLEMKYVELAAQQGRPVEEISAYYQKENYVEYLKDSMLDDKVVEYLLANAQIVWEDPVVHDHEHDHDHEHEHDHEHDHEHEHEHGEEGHE